MWIPFLNLQCWSLDLKDFSIQWGWTYSCLKTAWTPNPLKQHSRNCFSRWLPKFSIIWSSLKIDPLLSFPIDLYVTTLKGLVVSAFFGRSHPRTAGTESKETPNSWLAFKKLVLRFSKISYLVARHRFRLWSDPIGSSGKPIQKCLPRLANQVLSTQVFVYDLNKVNEFRFVAWITIRASLLYPSHLFLQNQSWSIRSHPRVGTPALAWATLHAGSTPPFLAHDTWPTTPSCPGVKRLTKKALCLSNTSMASGGIRYSWG